MKYGIAKFDAGIRTSTAKPYRPVDGGSPVIEKGRVYTVHDSYDFKGKQAIFKEASKAEVDKARGVTKEDK